MRSLWRILALEWLGGEGSQALTEDSTILEGLLGDEAPVRAFDVRREPQASRRAMIAPDPGPENLKEELLRSGFPGRYAR